MASLILKVEMGYLLLTFSFFTSAFAESHTYIIHMDSTAKPTAFFNHHYWYLATLSSIFDIVDSNVTPCTFNKHLYTYTSSANGFSATLTNSELEALKKHPGYISHTRDRPLQVHTTHTSQFLGLSTDSGAWPATNYGEDVIIGLLDTGIWPESESFNDEGMTPVPSRWKGKCEPGTQFNSSLCNKKLIGAYFFNKGYFAENPYDNISMNSTRDTNGHGTHTASTAAGTFVKEASFFGYANGTSSGMAPKARVAIYKTTWTYGVYASDVLAAIDQAIKDGVDILSLSLAFPEDYVFSLDEDAIAVATFAAMKEGIFVAASAGNHPDTIVNAAPWLLTVGAGTIDRDFGGILTLVDGNEISFGSQYLGNYSQSPTSLVFLDECLSVEEMKKNKKSIVVCKDNESMADQYERADTAGVIGVIFITSSTSENFIDSPFPAATVNLEDGQRVVDYIQKTDDPKGSWQFQMTTIGIKPSPMVDYYSGRGPFFSCKYVIKPDIIAPGSSVLASWSPISPVIEVREKPLFSNFNFNTGTSMSTPHVAGVAALVKTAHPDWSPAAIRSALMTTANPLDNTNGPIRDVIAFDNAPATPLDIGSGHIDPNKSLNPGLIYDATEEDYINLLCAMNYTKKQLQIITKSNPSCINMSLDLNYPSFIAYFTGSSDSASHSDEILVYEFQRTVTNVGEAVSSYSANLTNMDGLKVKVEPEKLEFKYKYEKLSYKLTVEGPKIMKEDVVYGSLSWVHDQGKYTVRSPIVATTKVQP
ncbi:subtilisin-like protease SBT1.9 [Euphorbia lathyris]|uniref:subtilisin-like protease SBT1.9 n=1 Tax=Euphorbia lathyris TaxID=212925 RepID=UPI0033132054